MAVGAGHRHLGVRGEHELENKGVTYCATCDGALPVFRNQPLVVVGGGDSACEEASYLTRFASQVYLVHRRDSLRASKIMAERTLANPKITPVWNSVVEEVLDRIEASGAEVNRTDGARVNTPDGWWLARAPNTQEVLVARAEASTLEGLDRLKAQLVEQLGLSGISPPEGF